MQGFHIPLFPLLLYRLFTQTLQLKVFGGNPAGVVQIKFKTEEAADACVALMEGRWYAGRRLEAGKWDGVTNHNVLVEETEEEQQARLEAYARELEAEGVGV